MGVEDQYKFWRTLVMGEQGSASGERRRRKQRGDRMVPAFLICTAGFLPVVEVSAEHLLCMRHSAMC